MTGLVPVVIYFFLPTAGLIGFLLVTGKMRNRKIQNPPHLSFLILFIAYGNLAMAVATVLFWKVSGLHSLVFIAASVLSVVGIPFVIFFLWQTKKWSEFHRYAFGAALLFFPLAAALIALAPR